MDFFQKLKDFFTKTQENSPKTQFCETFLPRPTQDSAQKISLTIRILYVIRI